MTVLVGMTMILVIVFFLVIILGIQIQITNVLKRVDELAKRLDSASR